MRLTPSITAIVVAGVVLAMATVIQAQQKPASGGEETAIAKVGDFSIEVPPDWKRFSPEESEAFERQYRQQSREIYEHFAGANDPSSSVEVAAYHTQGTNGCFAIISMSLPPQADLMPMLKQQIKPKMQYGIEQGIIKRYLGMVSVDKAPLTGFYTKVVGRRGNIEVSGGLEHAKKKNTIVQMTLLAPEEWKEADAVAALEKVLASVKLKGNEPSLDQSGGRPPVLRPVPR